MNDVVHRVVIAAVAAGRADATEAVRAVLELGDLPPVHQRRLSACVRALLGARSAAARAVLAGAAVRVARGVTPSPLPPRSLEHAPLDAAQAEGLAHLARTPEAVASVALLALDDEVGAARAALYRPSSILAEAPPPPEEDGVVGVRFDALRNTYVSVRIAPERSFRFQLRLRQFLDWDLEGFFVARVELAHRLAQAAVHPDDASPLADAEALRAVAAHLATAAASPDRTLAHLLDASVVLLFTATGGGDHPERVEWHLPPRLLAALVDVAEDGDLCARLAGAAAAARQGATDELAPRRRALAEVLARHDGVPRRHKRGHWAYVNLAGVGQTVAEMRADDGVMPRGRTLLLPETLSARYEAAVALKLRFVLNDALEINVLSDHDYWQVIARHGFPPNHETLSMTRPIVASGYLTIDRGRIIGLEDDGLMGPGKLPTGLPPMQAVLAALGFELDVEQLARHALVLDWEGFAACCARTGLPEAPDDPDLARQRLVAASHADRPALAVAYARRALDDRGDAVRLIAIALRGFRIINIGGRAVAAGDLPKDAEWIDERLAGYLVRKVAGA